MGRGVDVILHGKAEYRTVVGIFRPKTGRTSVFYGIVGPLPTVMERLPVLRVRAAVMRL